MNTKSKVGRKPIPVLYNTIIHNNNEYCIGSITSCKGLIKFIIDNEDSQKVMSRNWHISSVGYIVSYYPTENGIKQLLLHNFVMNRLTFPGKGATESVDHINRNPLDNRKENLRVISQSEQNINQGKKPRNIVKLPEDCGITPDDIPRHIWYIKPNGAHGDRFAIEFKTENLVWKSSSSKKLTVSQKLESTKQKLQELYIQYPYLNPETNTIVNLAEELTQSFQEIMGLL